MIDVGASGIVARAEIAARGGWPAGCPICYGPAAMTAAAEQWWLVDPWRRRRDRARRACRRRRTQATRAGLGRALDAGAAVLARGGSALDAVEAAVRVLEDDPHFNAGRGSVFTYDGMIEMDASIMDGASRNAGAVTGVTATRNPIGLARAGDGAKPARLPQPRGRRRTSRSSRGWSRRRATISRRAERRRQLDELRARPEAEHFDLHLKYGTVGAVALDMAGHVAAATSTGGLTGKRWGRIGDSPIIGAGTLPTTAAARSPRPGAGEYFIRVGVAHEICARIRLAGDARASGRRRGDGRSARRSAAAAG